MIVIGGMLLIICWVAFIAFESRRAERESQNKLDSVLNTNRDHFETFLDSLKQFNDTLNMMLGADPALVSLTDHLYWNEEAPHPEHNTRAALPFYIDSLSEDHGIKFIRIFGIRSGGRQMTGNIEVRNDSLFLLYWTSPTTYPGLAVYGKYHLTYSVNTYIRKFSHIILIDLDPFMRRRSEVMTRLQ